MQGVSFWPTLLLRPALNDHIDLNGLNDRIDRFNEEARRIVYIDYKSTFLKLLSEDKSFTIHQPSMQIFALECKKWSNTENNEQCF